VGGARIPAEPAGDRGARPHDGDAPSGRILVVGSINADLVVRVPHLPRPGETVAGARTDRHGGGKGANQAVAAARLGGDVRFVGAVGEDDIGEELVRELVAEGIEVNWVRRVRDTPSGIAVILVDDAGENEIAVALGANDALRDADVAAAFDAMRPGRRDVCLVGGFEIPDEAIAATLVHARDAGCRVVVSPAPARPLRDDVRQALFSSRAVLTPNEGEAAALAGVEEPENAARALAARTGAPVIVTLGDRGGLLADESGITRFQAHHVDVVDTTGAGDTLTGALAAELARDVAVREALRYAHAAAALSVTVAGARGGSPTRRAVDLFLMHAPRQDSREGLER
jgi:ribokinase